MRIKNFIVLTVFIIVICSCKQNLQDVITPQIIPIPQNQSITNGMFVLDQDAGIEFQEDFKISATFLKSYIEAGSPIKLKANHTISFIKDETLAKEGYSLEVLPKNITIKAKTDQGAFYALQSLRQLLPAAFENGSYKETKVTIPCITIQDEPRFQYRGMHLDVARHMFSVAFIKKYIDALALLKMNTFHWHLTDDQGWRIEIKKYPKLQEVAAFRDQTLVGHFSDQPQAYDGKRYGGNYTQEDIKEVVAYAKSRYITVIPEIEMPGHAQAAISAYPELGCSGETIKVAQTWGVFDDIFCAGKDNTFTFLEDVLEEVVQLFPSKFIHIGGDEAPKTHWENCEACQKRIQAEGLKDEHELQSYFIQRIEKYLNAKGKQIIGWDEILEGGLAPNATVMSWRGIKGAVEAAKQHHNVIMTPTSHCYFDYYQSTNAGEPLAIGGYLPLEKVYGFNPIPKELNQDESQYVLGVQGNLWTEYIPKAQHVEYMVFPRILAMSEVGWSHSENKNYEGFVNRVEHFNKRLDALHVNYANHLYEVEGDLISDEDLMYQLKTLTKGKQIRYTLDGSEPSSKSSIYEEPLTINASTTIKANVFNNEEKLGSIFSEIINLHKAVGKNITINKEPHKAYSGNGAQGLINGISGSDSRYGDKEWLGFWGDDIEIAIDFGEVIEINSITTRFHNGQGQWIYAPKTIEIDFPTNKGLRRDLIALSERDSLIVNLKGEFGGIKTNKLIIRVPSFGTIPEGKQGAGNKAWTFIDEIIIN